MQCAETPVAKDQKLQPSISLLVVFEKVNEILADNYREFPVVNQWQSLRKPVWCNVPNHPWPRPRRNTKIAAIDLFPCGLWESPQNPGNQLSRVSCGPVETPIEESTHETKAMQ
jgi:hypothetical protein